MKILLVDDSECSRSVTAAYLEQMGHPAIEAGDGESALEIFSRDTPDLVLLDVEMPGMDGYAVAREIRRRCDEDHWIPILFLSGRIGDEDIARGIEAGGDDYLTKPISATVLRAKLNAMRRIHTMQQRLFSMSQELTAANRSLLQLSSVDSLTGLANRRSFDHALETRWHHAQTSGRPLALMMCDIDYFKRYNDNYGHQAGDSCLRRVADVLATCVRDNGDFVARYGGEEFAVLMSNASANTAMIIARRILESVRAAQIPHGHSPVSPYVTLSLGVAISRPRDDSSPEQLIESADKALYASKDQGRKRATLFRAATQDPVTV